MHLSMWGHKCLSLLLCPKRVSSLSTRPGKVELAVRLPSEKTTVISGQGSVQLKLRLCAGAHRLPGALDLAANCTWLLPVTPGLSSYCFAAAWMIKDSHLGWGPSDK